MQQTAMRVGEVRFGQTPSSRRGKETLTEGEHMLRFHPTTWFAAFFWFRTSLWEPLHLPWGSTFGWTAGDSQTTSCPRAFAPDG